MLTYSKLFIPLISFFLISSTLLAQPSGGPYGPIQQFYELPDVSGTTYFVSPDGDANASGTSIDNPTNIETAIATVETGDAIVLRGGTYRTGNLELNQQIIMQPYQDELPVLKGTYEANDWEEVLSPDYYDSGLWRTEWTTLFPSRPDSWWRTQREGMNTPMHKFNNDMVFADGKFLQSAGWYNELDDTNFYIDYEEKYVYVAFNPTGKAMEITAFNQGLVITPRTVHGKEADGKGPTIRGIEFSQYAFHVIDVEGYFPEGVSDESEHGNDVVGTTLEHCTVSYGGRVGVFVLGDEFTLRHSKITDTSTEGLYVLSSDDVLLEKNIFTRNNIENITGYYPAGVKIFNQSHRVVVNDNLVTEQPNSNGIWYDVGNVDGVFTNNWLENVGHLKDKFTGQWVWPSRNAFFFEISEGVEVSGNVFVNNDHGILILNAAGAKIHNNTFVNSQAVIARDRRGENVDHFGWHIKTGPAVDERVNHEFYDNLLVVDESFNRPMIYVRQLPDMCEQFPEPALAKLDHNAYVKLSENDAPIIWMAQKIGNKCLTEVSTSNEMNSIKGDYSGNSLTLENYRGPLFQSIPLKNFELLDGFKGEKAARNYMGAYK